MSNYIYSNGELYNVDELAHAFKYVKREKVNGKWRYYYDDSEYVATMNKHMMAENWHRRASAGSNKKEQAESKQALKQRTKELKRAKFGRFTTGAMARGAIKVANMLNGVKSRKKKRIGKSGNGYWEAH